MPLSRLSRLPHEPTIPFSYALNSGIEPSCIIPVKRRSWKTGSGFGFAEKLPPELHLACFSLPTAKGARILIGARVTEFSFPSVSMASSGGEYFQVSFEDGPDNGTAYCIASMRAMLRRANEEVG
jgi:hypothetical protein